MRPYIVAHLKRCGYRKKKAKKQKKKKLYCDNFTWNVLQTWNTKINVDLKMNQLDKPYNILGSSCFQ